MSDLRKRLEQIERELINVQPHIAQACPDQHNPTFIDSHIDAALRIVHAALALPDDPPAAALREAFVAGWRCREVCTHADPDFEALRRHPDPPAAVLPEQTHARDPQVYPVSGVTRRVVGHVVPGPAPKREKRYVCEECGSDGEGGAVEYASGVVCHFRKIPKDGKIHSVMCSGLFEEEVRDEA